MGRQILDKQTWLKHRIELNGSYGYSEDWKTIIKLFENRIKDFYFVPINDILRPNNRKGEGFSVLTLQCALIEMFAAFKQGKIHTHKRPKKDEKRPTYEYYDSDKCFVEFLESEDVFENQFFIKDKETNIITSHPIFDAKEFYGKVRCGLMHEARTKEDWLISAAEPEKYDVTKFLFYNESDKTKKINRTILQKQLEKYFSSYIIKLSIEDVEGQSLRRLLARKLDHLYDVPAELSFDWWKEE